MRENHIQLLPLALAVPFQGRQTFVSGRNGGVEVLQLVRCGNVSYQRARHISERDTFYHSITTILNCNTTTLATNYNYIRNSRIRCFYNLLASAGIMARLAAHTTAPNPRTTSPCTTTVRLRFLNSLPTYNPLA